MSETLNSTPTAPEPQPLVELEVGPVAHGGHCVARLDGRVVFVRHALPGERVLARLTEDGDSAKFWRADAIEILEPSPDRVPAAWPAAGAGGAGGGELSHVSLPAQRRWKAAVLQEQLKRLAGLDLQVEVEGAPGDDERGGLGYRTRIDLVADDKGRAGMRVFRSHDVVPLDDMPLATPEVAALAEAEEVFTRRWRPGTRLELVAPAGGSDPILLVDGVVWHSGHIDRRPHARRAVTETVTVAGTEHTFRVAADGFWQVHREAPALLAEAVLAAAGPLEEATVVDLYSGAGLFTLPLADAVGETGRVVAIEGDERAVKDARRNAFEKPQVELHHGPVEKVLAAKDHAAPTADVVVLDPPRTGAGRKVVDAVAALRVPRVVYVACDPAALARDIAYFAKHGYVVESVTGYDLFPHTHHVEAIAVLTR
ncbi:class I SAM-dependent RNA methyltransferase [Oerskovia enterophila]|uniref:class I SAM-dependent RNA methyltransferase n=1 Tax=Oerskovia enterophila TaxID=43678 RepID=UPI0033936DC9